MSDTDLALIGGFVTGARPKLTTSGLLKSGASTLIDRINPRSCICTLDPQAGILLTKLCRIKNIPYIVYLEPRGERKIKKPPPASKEYLKLRESLLRDAYGVIDSLTWALVECIAAQNNEDPMKTYLRGRNAYLMSSSDASILLWPSFWEGMNTKSIVKETHTCKQSNHTAFIGELDVDEKKLIVTKWSELGPQRNLVSDLVQQPTINEEEDELPF